jgi:predicted amidohydrolase
MQSLRVAAVSLNSEFGNRAETIRRIEQFCEQAAAERAELAVFPELIVHGHCTPNTWEIAEGVPVGESVEALCGIARRSSLFLCAGDSCTIRPARQGIRRSHGVCSLRRTKPSQFGRLDAQRKGDLLIRSPKDEQPLGPEPERSHKAAQTAFGRCLRRDLLPLATADIVQDTRKHFATPLECYGHHHRERTEYGDRHIIFRGRTGRRRRGTDRGLAPRSAVRPSDQVDHRQ